LSDDFSVASLVSILIILLIFSAFFAGTETALMRLNRYKLKHQVRAGNRAAKIIDNLLKKPDMLIGLILLGNNLVNFTAVALVTMIALKMGGESSVAIATLILTVFVLIFCDAAPKTLAALYPERLAFPSAFIYYPLMIISYPVVRLISALSNGLLWIIGVRTDDAKESSINNDELRTIVHEAGTLITRNYRSMLLNILDLEKVTVDDVMVPHTEVLGIDIQDDISEIREVIINSEHTLLPVFRENINQVFGIIHLRKLANLSGKNLFQKKDIEKLSFEPYFIQEGVSLNTQLIEFRRSKQRFALVVDEYGDIQGIVTMADILEEIVGEFTTDPTNKNEEFRKESDNCFLVNGNANIRDLNKALNWKIPSSNAKTINGLILEHLGDIPEPKTRINISDYSLEVIAGNENFIHSVRIKKYRN
jgi:Mg2+/Co2+ transporter CorB|tara:strand:+ start:15185 stop:16447 length:1263 start_codon:yes stop_codon:yes gene_type:complete